MLPMDGAALGSCFQCGRLAIDAVVSLAGYWRSPPFAKNATRVGQPHHLVIPSEAAVQAELGMTAVNLPGFQEFRKRWARSAIPPFENREGAAPDNQLMLWSAKIPTQAKTGLEWGTRHPLLYFVQAIQKLGHPSVSRCLRGGGERDCGCCGGARARIAHDETAGYCRRLAVIAGAKFLISGRGALEIGVRGSYCEYAAVVSRNRDLATASRRREGERLRVTTREAGASRRHSHCRNSS
jgi:hypothetical protein